MKTNAYQHQAEDLLLLYLTIQCMILTFLRQFPAWQPLVSLPPPPDLVRAPPWGFTPSRLGTGPPPFKGHITVKLSQLQALGLLPQPIFSCCLAAWDPTVSPFKLSLGLAHLTLEFKHT